MKEEGWKERFGDSKLIIEIMEDFTPTLPHTLPPSLKTRLKPLTTPHSVYKH